jgi:hypothetical protein
MGMGSVLCVIGVHLGRGEAAVACPLDGGR